MNTKKAPDDPELVKLLKKLGFAKKELFEASKQFEQLKRRIETAERNYANTLNQVVEEMKRVDVACRGNFGFEARLAHLLMQVVSSEKSSRYLVTVLEGHWAVVDSEWNRYLPASSDEDGQRIVEALQRGVRYDNWTDL